MNTVNGALLICLISSFFVTLTNSQAFAEGSKINSATDIKLVITIQPGQNDFLTANDIQPLIFLKTKDESKSIVRNSLLCYSKDSETNCEYFLNDKQIPLSYNVSVKKDDVLKIVVQFPIGLVSQNIIWRILDKDPTITPAGAPMELLHLLTGGYHHDTIWSGQGNLEDLVKDRTVYQNSSDSGNKVSIKAKAIGCKSFGLDELDSKAKHFDEQISIYETKYKATKNGMFFDDPNRLPAWEMLKRLDLYRESIREIRTGQYPCTPAN